MPQPQKSLYELCIEHLSVLVNRAELAPFQGHLERDAWATTAAAAGTVAVGDTAAGLSPRAGRHLSSGARLPSSQPQEDPHDESGNARKPSLGRGLNFSIGMKAEVQPGRKGDGDGASVGPDGLSGHGGGNSGERDGLGQKPRLQRQPSSLDSHGAASVVSSVRGEFHEGTRAFLLPEEEQVPPILLHMPIHDVWLLSRKRHKIYCSISTIRNSERGSLEKHASRTQKQ